MFQKKGKKNHTNKQHLLILCCFYLQMTLLQHNTETSQFQNFELNLIINIVWLNNEKEACLLFFNPWWNLKIVGMFLTAFNLKFILSVSLIIHGYNLCPVFHKKKKPIPTNSINWSCVVFNCKRHYYSITLKHHTFKT